MENLLKMNRSWRDIFEEVPITIRNSHLVNACLFELEDSSLFSSDRNFGSYELLDLETNSFLEKNLESLIDSVEELSNEQSKFYFYQRNLQKQAAYRQKRKQEIATRRLAGEEELPEEEEGAYKAPVEPSSLKSLLKTNQILTYCDQINQFSGQSFSKLFLLSGLKE